MAKKKQLGIIDFEKKGNVVRFYIGDINKEYWGDDWNDRPYEHNAGTVYSQYVDRVIDIAFPFDCDVLEPADDWHYRDNSPFCKEDFMNRKAPCIIVVPNQPDTWNDNCYSELCGSENVIKFFYGDSIDTISQYPDQMTIIHYVNHEFKI